MATTGAEIAIVGMAGRFPGAGDVRRLWKLVQSGAFCLAPVSVVPDATRSSQGHWVRTACLVPDAAAFDAAFFDIGPGEAKLIEPQQRLFLETAWSSLEDAGFAPRSKTLSVGVYGGGSFTSYCRPDDFEHLLEGFPALIGADKDYLATRVAHRLNLNGPAITVQSACSTSLVAVHLACQALIAGECDAAVAGGVSVTLPRNDYHFHMPGGILSADGYCRAFDARASGTVFSEGCATVVLRRLEDALRDRDYIYAVILGSALNNDAASKSGFAAPSIEGQAEVLRQAYAVARLSPRDIGYIEAHGTATVVGDAVELAALARVFKSADVQTGSCHIGSIKSNVGHLACAAGVAGLIKAALVVRDGIIPPIANFAEPNPEIDPESSPFTFDTEARVWDAPSRRAGVSSFGVGGTNAHVVLEQPPARPANESSRTWHLIPLSARSEATLARGAAELKERLDEEPGEIDRVAFTLDEGRAPLKHRRISLVSHCGELDPNSQTSSHDVISGFASEAPSIAFMFPGQGSQYAGMAASLYRREPAFHLALDECLELVKSHRDLKLRSLLLAERGDPASDQALQRTEVAQPAIFAVEFALLRLLDAWGVKPDIVIGHSLGEIAAVVAAGALSLRAAVDLVVERGRLMQGCGDGRMISVGLPADQLLEMLPQGLAVASDNAPELSVASGSASDMSILEDILQAHSIVFRPLRTSHAFHSAMMDEIVPRFRMLLRHVDHSRLAVPLASNVTGAVYQPGEELPAEHWIDHLRKPVLFRAGVASMLANGADILLEIGPGRALCSMARQNGTDRQGVRLLATMPDASTMPDDGKTLLRAIGRLWVEGAPVRLSSAYAQDRPFKHPLPPRPLERRDFGFGRTGNDRRRVMVAGGKLQPSEWAYAESFHRRSDTTSAVPKHDTARSIVLLDRESSALGRHMARRFRDTGAVVNRVVPGSMFQRRRAGVYAIDSNNPEHYERLFSAVGTVSAVVHLWSLQPSAPEAIETVELDQDTRLFSLLHLSGALRKAGLKPRLDIVTTGLYSVLGDETLAPVNAGVAIFAIVAPQEQPGSSVRLIELNASDLDRGDARLLADDVLNALNSGYGGALALRGRHQWAPCFDHIVLDPAKPGPEIRAGGAYLVVGGLGELGLIIADWLSREWGATVILAGRTGVSRDKATDETDGSAMGRQDILSAIRSRGTGLVILQADVASLEGAQRLRASVGDSPLNGIFYAAGAMGPTSTLNVSASLDEFRAHLRSKTLGLAHVDRAFGDLSLDFRVVFSSISTALGGLGHCGYATSNLAVDLLTETWRRSRPKTSWLSIDWDLWRTPRSLSSAAQRSALQTAIQPEEGLSVLPALLRLGCGRVLVSTTDLAARIAKWVRLEASVSAPVAAPSGRLDGQMSEPITAAQSDWSGHVEETVGGIWLEALGLDVLNRGDDYFDSGGDSLTAVRIVGRINEAFDVDLSLEGMLEARTVQGVAELVDNLVHSPRSAATVA